MGEFFYRIAPLCAEMELTPNEKAALLMEIVTAIEEEARAMESLNGRYDGEEAGGTLKNLLAREDKPREFERLRGRLEFLKRLRRRLEVSLILTERHNNKRSAS